MYKLVILFLVFWSLAVHAQDQSGEKLIGFTAMVYPAGIITNASLEQALDKKKSLNYSLGYNTARRQDFGRHTLEEGSGPGISFGYRIYAKPENSLFAEVKLSIWQLRIGWEDIRNGRNVKGETDITVLQPLLLAGYRLRPKTGKLSYTFGASVGREWNVITKGEQVGQGGISLLFASLFYKL